MRAAPWKSVLRFRNPLSPTTDSALFHSSPVSFAKWRSKSDPDDEGTNQEQSKTRIRFSVHQKRSDAKAALKNLLFDGRPSQQYFQDEDISWSTDKKSSRNVKAKDSSHDFDKHQRSKSAGRPKPHSKGKHSANKRWRNRQSSYDEDDYEHPDTKISATFGGQRCFTWSFTSGETLHFQNYATGFEWRDNSERIKTRKKVWSESDIEDEPSDIGSQSHRVILGLPLTGPLKLDDVKHAFHATALKWHPDKHQGPSQAIAEERFKLCVDAYNSLCKALNSS
ncbi:uncharacterized protein LOC103703174 [Phoenix dactylifera]|uniref:Uncharacterized protein LOC103703174 n=1 Tax=Phoenix dactylifera TaxID=42345 RepID=A0A8B7BS19_PHODC|nr:uncharacterized protein LOC103703174 [Phoenix dactylifera]